MTAFTADQQMHRDRRDAEADSLLASLTVEQLRAGRRKALDMLATVQMMDATDEQMLREDIGHPGRHPSRSYEVWAENHSDTLRRQYQSALRDVEAELGRRGEPLEA